MKTSENNTNKESKKFATSFLPLIIIGSIILVLSFILLLKSLKNPNLLN
jgi:hypothetical protein